MSNDRSMLNILDEWNREGRLPNSYKTYCIHEMNIIRAKWEVTQKREREREREIKEITLYGLT